MTDPRADIVRQALIGYGELAHGLAPGCQQEAQEAIADLDGLLADAAEQRAALAMLWQNYLLPISDEQKAQVMAALEKQA